jgi:hypothetical protein
MPTIPGLTCGNAHPVFSFNGGCSVNRLPTAVSERLPTPLFSDDFESVALSVVELVTERNRQELWIAGSG